MSISDPEYYFEEVQTINSDLLESQNYIDRGVYEARRAEREMQRERERKKNAAIIREMEKSAKEREEAQRFNAQPPYTRLKELLIYHARYLSKSSNPEDRELEQMIYVGLIDELPKKRFETMDKVFKILETRAINNQDLAYALEDWKKIYDELKQSLGASIDSEKNGLEGKKAEYDKVSFFGRLKNATIAFFSTLSGKEKTEEKGKQM